MLLGVALAVMLYLEALQRRGDLPAATCELEHVCVGTGLWCEVTGDVVCFPCEAQEALSLDFRLASSAGSNRLDRDTSLPISS